jgi:cytochrome c
MNARTLPTIEMPNRRNFIPDDRPDTRAERCMKNCEPIGTVADAEAGPTIPGDRVISSGGTGNQVIMGPGSAADGQRPSQ